MSAALALYRGATGLLEPFAPSILKDRARRGKEDPQRLPERLGRAGKSRPEGPLVWLHGASVGESLSLLPLVERMRKERPDVTPLVTSGTVTSAEILAKRLPTGAVHQYVPVDAPGTARRFLSAWRPDLAVFVESELWPNLLLAARRRGVRLALISARMGEDSAQGWTRAAGAARELLAGFDLILPQDDEAAARLKALGARDDGRLNLKFAGDPLPADQGAVDRLGAAVAGRPVLLAASTHPGEDEIVLDAFAPLADRRDAPLLVIVPRHPIRGPDVARLARQGGRSVSLQSAGEQPGSAQVHVADALGELGLWFRQSRAAFVGGSLIPDIGGHNPLEPARLDRPAASGPHVDNWRAVYAALDAAGGIAWTADAAALTAFFRDALDGRTTLCSQAEHARLFAAAQNGAVDLAFAKLKALLP
jgi:3-deoxy-D-manno-octulosonic-acid transferase